ncbi:MAG: 50S ribosomal protein L4 [Hyphomicrobiaceae bacterium hypho_1]
MQVDVTNLNSDLTGTIELNEQVFGLEPRLDILHRMVRYQLLKRMAGTHHTKDRSEVRATGRKFVRQKGSGGARHSSKKAPQFRGGGKAFGPKTRSHFISLPKKVRSLALRHALSSKLKSGDLSILDRETSLDGKTKGLKQQLSRLGWFNALIIGGNELEPNFVRAAGNIPLIDVLPVQGINVYDILRRRRLVLTKTAVELLEKRFSLVSGIQERAGMEAFNEIVTGAGAAPLLSNDRDAI